MTEQTNKIYYERFSAAQRLEHMVLLLAFLGLALTGFLQKYSAEEFARWVIELWGGMESIRIMHRAFAVAFMFEALYHGLTVSYNLYVRGLPASLKPRRQDFQDALDWIRYNIGLKKDRPKLPYFNFGQKWDYWMTIIGGGILMLTGLMMWNPTAITSIFPGQLIPAARAIHGGQALVLVASVVIWHIYSVWVKQFNRSILTGKISHRRMAQDHGGYLENPVPPMQRPANEMAEKRQRYMTIAGVATLVLVGGTFLFLSYEKTAIDTVPRQTALIYAPNFEIAEGDPEVGAAIWQTERCAYCHGADAESPLTETTPSVFGTELSFEVFYQQVRTGKNEMPAFSTEEIPDRYLLHMYSWLITGANMNPSDAETSGE